VPKSAKRDAIADAARNEFSERGYHGARLERIAATARANKQLIFHYFGAKDGLYEAVVSAVLSDAAKGAGPGASPPEALRRHAEDVATWFAATPGAALLLNECLSGMEMPSGAVTVARDWLETEYSILRSIVDDGQRKGYFRDDIDLGVATQLIVSASVGNALLSKGKPGVGSGGSGAAALLGQLIADYCAWR
jgi:TetR/AcrR family transcriptional regulator